MDRERSHQGRRCNRPLSVSGLHPSARTDDQDLITFIYDLLADHRAPIRRSEGRNVGVGGHARGGRGRNEQKHEFWVDRAQVK